MKHLTASLVSIPLLFTTFAFGQGSLDCKQKIPVEGIKFDFSKLDNIHSVWVVDRDSPPATYNTTWTLNICRPFNPDEKQPNWRKDQCPSSTNICGIKRSWNEADDPEKEHVEIENVIPLAGSWKQGTGQTLHPTWKRLRSLDANEEGLQMELQGGTYDKIQQKAVIHFLCDRDALEKGDDDKEKRDDDKDGDDAKPDNSTQSEGDLKFVSYSVESGKKAPVQVLRLDWKTKYACEDYDGTQTEGSKGWNFFTWLFLVVFMGTAAYLIFGSWLNYNRYGARGWDLLPHGDTIRDIPYLVKDWGKKVVDTVSGPGSRGGYSAV